MSIKPEVFEVIVMLDQAGLSDLSAELHDYINQSDAWRSGQIQVAAELIKDEPRLPRPPIDQALATIDFLRVRLVEPVRRVQQAEILASALSPTTSAKRRIHLEGDGSRDLFPDDVRSAAGELDSLLGSLLAALRI